MSNIYFITKEKLKEINHECESIKRILQEKTFDGVPNLLEGSDTNPDFAIYQQTLDELNLRIEELENVIKNHKIINIPPAKERDKVQLGAKIFLKDNQAKETELRLVGTIEANPFEGKISNESPAGMAFIGKKAGDTVQIGPSNINYKILKIQYEDA
ncbi:MAG: GreA/GreB family elongation factor [Candidatus Paceibacterota bacterium]|jgi:transcription elongation factor GreA